MCQISDSLSTVYLLSHTKEGKKSVKSNSDTTSVHLKKLRKSSKVQLVEAYIRAPSVLTILNKLYCLEMIQVNS